MCGANTLNFFCQALLGLFEYATTTAGHEMAVIVRQKISMPSVLRSALDDKPIVPYFLCLRVYNSGDNLTNHGT